MIGGRWFWCWCWWCCNYCIVLPIPEWYCYCLLCVCLSLIIIFFKRWPPSWFSIFEFFVYLLHVHMTSWASSFILPIINRLPKNENKEHQLNGQRTWLCTNFLFFHWEGVTAALHDNRAYQFYQYDNKINQSINNHPATRYLQQHFYYNTTFNNNIIETMSSVMDPTDPSTGQG